MPQNFKLKIYILYHVLRITGNPVYAFKESCSIRVVETIHIYPVANHVNIALTSVKSKAVPRLFTVGGGGGCKSSMISREH